MPPEETPPVKPARPRRTKSVTRSAGHLARAIVQPQLLDLRETAGGEPQDAVVLNQAPLRNFDAAVDLAYVAALQALGYVMTCFLHQDWEMAQTQVRLLNETLARLEFEVELDTYGRPVLTSRLRDSPAGKKGGLDS